MEKKYCLSNFYFFICFSVTMDITILKKMAVQDTYLVICQKSLEKEVYIYTERSYVFTQKEQDSVLFSF